MEETVRDEQANLWNGDAGRAWVEAQALTDQLFAPIEQLLGETVAARPGSRVLDVGCGTGATTVAAARSAGTHGTGTGVDISEPMIAAARARAEREGVPARFLVADAQTHPFERASFDLVVSRFGVMFFADPVAAFANLRNATAAGGELRIVVWRDRSENPFMTVAPRAAAPLVAMQPAPAPDAPGQFAFADPERVRAILAGAGWSAIAAAPVDVPCAMPASALVPYVTRMGPVGRAIADAEPAFREQVLAQVLPAFDPFVHGDEVRFTAACWSVTAHV